MKGAGEAFWCSHDDYWYDGSRVLCCSMCGSLVLCQDLAGPWYAQRQRGTVDARVQWFSGSCGSEEGIVAQVRQKLRGMQ